MFKILIASILIIKTLSTLGVDLSTLASVDSFKCLLNSNRTFFVARSWHSYGGFDINVPKTLENAKQAGFSSQNMGVYMFPCFSTTKTPQSQIQQMIGNLSNTKYSQIWVDMETNTSPGCGWSKNFEQNCKFTQQLVNAAKKYGKKVGIYASNYMWTSIMGSPSNCAKFSDFPLWYAHYDGIPSFSDFKPFGGWTKPTIKQYKGTSSLCGASVDLNYHP